MLEQPISFGIYKMVRLLRTILTVLLAAAWMPLTAHCRIETATGLELLLCQCDGTAGQTSGSCCDDTSCCDWESGLYHSPQTQALVVPHLVGVVPADSLARMGNDVPVEGSASAFASAPPGPPKPWQFALRAALPVRAPSVTS